MSTFHYLVLQIETSWTTSIFQSILETRNVDDVCMYDLFIPR